MARKAMLISSRCVSTGSREMTTFKVLPITRPKTTRTTPPIGLDNQSSMSVATAKTGLNIHTRSLRRKNPAIYRSPDFADLGAGSLDFTGNHFRFRHYIAIHRDRFRVLEAGVDFRRSVDHERFVTIRRFMTVSKEAHQIKGRQSSLSLLSIALPAEPPPKMLRPFRRDS